MASEVDIANLALAHLGDTATVASLDPPEGSAQAEHCARFYPIARDALLELHTWGFATKRVALAQLTNSTRSEWGYAYAQPADAITLLSVLPPEATDDYSEAITSPDWPSSVLRYNPQPYSAEVDPTGASVIYTDQVDAVLRYVGSVTDSSKFSPLFTLALSWQLASMLAGPIIKGDAGAAEAKRCAAMAQAIVAQARTSDANQRKTSAQHRVGWIEGR